MKIIIVTVTLLILLIAAFAFADSPTISSSKAEMMGYVEFFFMNNYKDVTWRKSLEWGNVENNKDGTRSIRYMCEAKIWDKDTTVMNQTFTFDSKGSIIGLKNVKGYPKKKESKADDVNTQK